MITKHGEFKTPGGKLVQVDFKLVDHQLSDVLVSGDFFLYPDDALGPITGAVEGTPASMTIDDRAALIARSIPEGVEWLGSSPIALATAIERALSTSD